MGARDEIREVSVQGNISETVSLFICSRLGSFGDL
ncbi:predicted protein [Botrytis cinerea T4]|uniref:Uncharacterized protein n=1 Tax=Botryotinia fuckeliana (strain T4) TaxID=999810 RepID=G2Y4W7_BOTF4|nr:predicted protein [Botrytis cinerea T4]